MRTIHRVRRKLAKFKSLKTVYLCLFRLLPVHKSYEINRKLRSPYSTLEDKHKIIYIHIPKAAGNALIKSLFGVSATGHDPLSRYLANNDKKFREYYKFAVVRNPFDRLVSSFFYLKQGGIGFFDDDFSRKYLFDIQSFDHFVKKLNDDVEFRNAVMTWVHFIPQINFLSLNGTDLHIDKVVKLENLDKELNELCSQIGVPPVKIIRYNSSKRKNFKEYYTRELIEIVESLYQQDLKVLKYTFED